MIGPRASGSRLAQTALIVSVFGMPGCLPVYWEQFYKPDPDGAAVASYRCGGDPTQIHGAPPSVVTVTFPTFLIDDRAVDARVIRFHLDRHVQFMVPINC